MRPRKALTRPPRVSYRCSLERHAVHVKELFKLVCEHRSVHEPGTVVALDDVCLIAFAAGGDVAHDRLQDVAHGHQPLEAAVLVNDERCMRAVLFEASEHFESRHALWIK
jgi:hypothetical protein